MLPKDVKSGKIPKPLGIVESEIKTGIDARYVLKRISKENIKDMGRELSKRSHNNPLVVFTDILAKIESYDNLILMMVDTFQFATELSLDVMGYCLLLSLGGGDGDGHRRSGTKMGGLNTEQWLASLETFTGAFYKKFPEVELRGILIYLTTRFKDGHASELGVLRSLIKTAGGYGFVDFDSTASLSELQLDGRCGSRLLKRETSSFGVVDTINQKASQQLREVLQGGDLGVIMILLLSQMRSKILYAKADSGAEHVKVIGNTYDDCEAVLCLLLEFLSDSSDDQASGPSTKEKFASSMPSLEDLHAKYGLDTAVAWMICRPLIRKSMFFMDDNKLMGKVSQKDMPDFLKRFASSPEMTKTCKNLLPGGAWKHITPAMFQAFYTLSIYDILCPAERYSIEIGRLKKEVERLSILQKGGDAARGQMSALAAAAAAAGANPNEIRQATAFTTAHKMELERLKRNVDQLNKDFDRQQKRCKFVKSQLEAQIDVLITSGEGNPDIDGAFSSAFMTFCIYPRCFLSPEDSLFCAHFIKMLHNMRLPGFLTVELIDNIVNAATGSLYCMTEDEAGKFLLHYLLPCYRFSFLTQYHFFR
jgi:THO complex subunit 2